MQRKQGSERIPVTNSGETEEVRLHLMVSLYSFSSGSNAQGESRALEGRRVSSESLKGFETETKKLLGGMEENSFSLARGH